MFEKLEELKKTIAAQRQYFTRCKQCGKELADNSRAAMVEHTKEKGHRLFEQVKK